MRPNDTGEAVRGTKVIYPQKAGRTSQAYSDTPEPEPCDLTAFCPTTNL
jgi:hypothetical protein